MRILIIGGAGYIGTRLCEILNKMDIQYSVLDTHEPVIDTTLYKYIHCLRNNGTSKLFLDSLLRGFTHVINLSGMVGEPQSKKYPKQVNEMNVDVSEMVAKACKKHSVKLIHISTCSVYGFTGEHSNTEDDAQINPIGVYGKSKYKAEQAIMKHADFLFRPVILRLGTVFGWSPKMRYDLSINTMLWHALSDIEFTVYSNGEQSRPFTYIDNVANTIISVLECKTSEIYNVVDRNIDFLSLGNIIAYITGAQLLISNENPDARSYKASGYKLFSKYDIEHITFSDALNCTSKKIKKHLRGSLKNMYDSQVIHKCNNL